MPEEPKAAVIIPCFNDGAFVGDAIASLDEDFPTELVVVDDRSADPATRRVLEALEGDGIRVLRHDRNRGVAVARNTGLAATRAPFVFPLDADDLAATGALPAMVDVLERNPGAVVAYGDYREFGEQDVVRAVPESVDAYRLMYTNEYPPTALYRRSFLEQVGGWQTARINGYYYEDWALWMTIAERGAGGVHMGTGFETYRQRVHGPRLLEAVKRNHVPIYRHMRSDHATLFAGAGRHRSHSTLGPARRLLYPLVYGGRRRFGFEPKLKGWLDQLGIWTLRR